MASQNLTLRLQAPVLKKAKALAARRGTSLNRLLADTIEELARGADRYVLAKRRARALLERGFAMGPLPKLSRDEIHERR
ncbi:MAG: CopG family transcriptional regulator [Deltaproteobacteria bacterium]|nr:CopG family transcriptional regulator [Deltaproteobacteria bacterium]